MSEKTDTQTGAGSERVNAIGVPVAPNGRFVPGFSGNPRGRSRGIQIRRVCEEYAEREGIDLERAIWEVMRTQLALAKIGDRDAVKIVLTTLGDSIDTDEVRESLAEALVETIAKNHARLAAS